MTVGMVTALPAERPHDDAARRPSTCSSRVRARDGDAGARARGAERRRLPSVMGVATSGSIMFRQIGGSVGIARLRRDLRRTGCTRTSPGRCRRACTGRVRRRRRRERAAAACARRCTCTRSRPRCTRCSSSARSSRALVRAHVVPQGGAAAQDDRGRRGRVNELDLLDWKRRIFELYAEVRAADDPRAGWERWRAVRDELFRDHPQSPSPGYAGLATSTTTRHCACSPREAGRGAAAIEIDGASPLPPLRRRPLRLGTLDLYWLEGYGGGVFLPVRRHDERARRPTAAAATSSTR